MMRMPSRMSTATPPITAPAMTPGDIVEDVDNNASGGVEDCKASDVVELAVEVRVVGMGEVLLALDAAEVDCDVVWAGSAAGRLGIAVGIASPMLWLDKKELTTPPTLFKILFICRRSWLYLRCTVAVPMFPATRQTCCMYCSAVSRSRPEIALDA